MEDPARVDVRGNAVRALNSRPASTGRPHDSQGQANGGGQNKARQARTTVSPSPQRSPLPCQASAMGSSVASVLQVEKLRFSGVSDLLEGT